MKNIRNYKSVIAGIACAFGLVIIQSCGPDVPEIESAQDIAFELLAGDWDLGEGAGSISVDGTNVSANYTGFSLAFTDGAYRTSNAEQLFNATGTWQWIDENASMIRLDDGKEITINDLNLFRFTFSFNFADGGARAGIPGNYTISVVK